MKHTHLRVPALLALSVFATEFTAPTLAIAGGDACKSICGEYKAAFVPDRKGEMNLQYVIQNCGPMPGGGQVTPGAGTKSIHVNQQGQSTASTGSGASTSQQGVSFDMKTGDAAWDACFVTIQGHWKLYGEQCDAIDATDKAKTPEKVALVAYGVAAASCGLACANPYYSPVCTFAGVASTLLEIQLVHKLQEEFAWTESMTLGSIGTAGGAVSNSSNKVAKVGACLAAGTLAFASMSRYGKIDGMDQAADDICTSLKKYLSNADTFDPKSDFKAPPADEQRKNANSLAKGPGTLASGQGGGNGTSPKTLPPEVQKSLRDFPNSQQFAKATAGDVIAPLFKAIEGKDLMADALKQAAGLSLEDLAKRLDSGESISQIAASTPGLAAMSANLAKFEDAAKKRGYSGSGSMMASSGAYSRASGGGKAAAPANPFAMFGGMKGPGGIGPGEAPKDMTFEKAKRELAALDGNGDIWHEGFGGTIFQIVSQKLDRTRERIDELEWESPLNRALTGLPAKKPGRSAAGVK